MAPLSVGLIVVISLDKGEQLALKRRPKEALPYFMKALEDPNNVDAAIQLAFLMPTPRDGCEFLEDTEKKGIAACFV